MQQLIPYNLEKLAKVVKLDKDDNYYIALFEIEKNGVKYFTMLSGNNFSDMMPDVDSHTMRYSLQIYASDQLADSLAELLIQKLKHYEMPAYWSPVPIYRKINESAIYNIYYDLVTKFNKITLTNEKSKDRKDN